MKKKIIKKERKEESKSLLNLSPGSHFRTTMDHPPPLWLGWRPICWNPTRFVIIMAVIVFIIRTLQFCFWTLLAGSSQSGRNSRCRRWNCEFILSILFLPMDTLLGVIRLVVITCGHSPSGATTRTHPRNLEIKRWWVEKNFDPTEDINISKFGEHTLPLFHQNTFRM